MPKIKIYIDAEGVEHRVGPNSESRFLEDYDGARFSREEYVFAEDKEENELYNKKDFSLNNILKSSSEEPEEEEDVTYKHQSASSDEVKLEGGLTIPAVNVGGWVKQETDIPRKTTTEPVKEKDVPDDAFDGRIALLQERYDNGEQLTGPELMDLDRMTRAEEKDSKAKIKKDLDNFLATTKKRAPIQPTQQTTIPQNAMIGDGDVGGSYVQGNISGTTKEMDLYQKEANAHNLEQKNNNNSESAKYYKKALTQLKNQGKGTSEEEVLVQAMEVAAQDKQAEHIQQSIKMRRQKYDDTLASGEITLSDESKSEDQLLAEYAEDIAIGKDAAGNVIYGPKLQESIEETSITENMLTSNAQVLTDQKTKIDANNKYWRDQYSAVETDLEEYSGVPATISTLNDLNKQITAFTDKAEGGALPEKEYNEYKNLVDKYNKAYSNNKGDIDSYVKLQKKYQDIDFNYKSAETENGKSKTDDLIVNYNKGIQNQGILYKTYQLQINDQNGMLDDNRDIEHYVDVMGRNHNNIAQLGGILTNGFLELGMTLETVKHQLNPRTLIADGLKEYYKGDPDEAPEMIKALLMTNDAYNARTRDETRKAVKGVQDYLTDNVQRRTEWKDLGDGVNDGYEWGEYILGAVGDFVPQVALMVAAPQVAIHVLGASAAGGKYQALKEENNHGGDYSMAQMYMASALSYAVEFGTERYTFNLLNKTGKGLNAVRDRGFREGMKNLLNPRVISGGILDMAGESGSEVLAEIGNNLSDRYLLKKDISVLANIDESAFNGFIMAGTMKSPLIFKQIVSPFMRPEDSAVFEKNDAKIFEINKQLENKDLSDEARSVLKDQADILVAENNKVISRIIDNTDEMTTAEKKIIKEADVSLYKTKETVKAIQADKSISDKDRKALIEQTLNAHYKLNKQKNETLKEVNLRNDMKVAEKGLKKLDPNAKLEGIETRREFQERYEEITGKKDDVRNKDAFFDPISGDAYVNKTRAKQVGAVSAGSHELLHKIMKNVLNGTDGKLTTKGKTLIDGFLNSIPAKHRAIIQKRIDDNYRYERGPNREIIKEKDKTEYYEEYLNSYSDAIRKKEINPKDGDLLGAGRKLRDFFSDSGYENLKFNSGRDVKNFIKDYAADIKSGEVRESILAVGEGDGAKIGEAKFSESAFEDASVVEDLGLKDSTADIVRKNNKIEEAILREGVKDKDGNIIASPNMQKALATNNLPRAFALARQAANKGNDLTLEEGLKMNDVKEFFSEYALKLTELARTYKAEMKDPKTGVIKKVPFGAYMNSLLPLKYSGILNKLKNKVQASSMSEEATAKEVGKIATPSAELANNEVEGRKVALNTIDQAEVQEQLVNIIKKGNIKLFKYKDVKSELTKHRKFIGVKNAKGEVIEEIEITPELKAQYKEDGKKPPKELKSLRKPSGQLYPALEAVSAIFSVDPMRIITEQDLDGPQRVASQNEILKFTNEIIAMMPFGTTASGDATGIANTKLGLFFEKGSKTLMKDTGSGKGLNKQIKQNIDPTVFRTLVGLVAKARMTNTSVDGAIRAVIVQVATIAANQAIRQTHGLETNALKDGKASTMFSETYAEEGNYSDAELSKLLLLEQGTWKSILERFDQDHIDMNSEVGREMLEMWIWENGVKQMPSVFWKASGNWTGTTKSIKDKDGNEIGRKHTTNLLYRSVPELKAKVQLELNKQAVIQYGVKAEYNSLTSKQKASVDAVVFPADSKYSKQELVDFANALKRKGLTDKTLADQEFKESKRRGIELIWRSFDTMIENNPTHATYVAAMLASSSGHQGHFMRITALHEFDTLEPTSEMVDGKKKTLTTEEHQQPATDLAKFLFNRMLHRHLFGENGKFEIAIKSHAQGRLLNVDDAKLKNKEEGWSYQSDAGEYAYPILMKGMSAWVRYFNPKVNNNNGGINPNSYKLDNGSTVAEEFGVGVPVTLQTPAVIARQQELIYKVITGQVSQAAATKAINSFSNAKFSSTIESDVKLDKAAKFSSTVNAPKGITVLDFDDTLATTKSGVRAKIPNTDGKPKPKRKVVFLAGGAGSGKGNVVGKLGLEDQGFKVVNSDISLEWLKKNNGLPADMNDLTAEQRSKLGSLQHQSRGIAKRKMGKYQGNGDGVVVDGTGGSIKSMQGLVSQFEADGYDVSMMFVETSLPVALERNAARKERSLLDKIVTRNHESVQGNKDGFKMMFGDRFMEVNTDKLSQEDAMPTELTDQMNDFVSGYENRRLDAEEFASEGANILDQGGTFDFSEFNKVVEGKTAPLFNKAMKLQGKFGNKDMFVLTARPAESAPAIFEFLQANGLNIPLSNITGLANSTAESKANWMAEKVSEGYNDFYFADDAMQNVKAVKDMLNQYDVKSKVQQAKVKFSETLSPEFNDILEQTTGVESQKQFSDAQAKIRGARTKYKSIIPASAQDFAGLLYNFLGKGAKGEADMAFFKKALIDPFARGISQLNTSRQNSANDYKNLQKAFPEVKKMMTDKVGETEFNNDQAARVYLWNKAGFEVPGLSKRDLKTLVEHVEGNPSLQAYADGISLISKKENGYSKPGDFWLAENITSDLLSDGSIGDARADVLTEWQQNADIMFSKENLNKIEAIYGSKFREALEDSLYRMRTGKNRPAGGGRIMNNYMNWVNNSVGAIMFFNMRSAILQTISATNYINWSFNNPAKAAMAFANQKQYWKDFSMLFNSPYLKQRRSGNQRGINEAELSAAVAGAENKAKAAIAWLLKKGFLPTQLADSFAIASGGATFFRNKVKALVKEGMTQEQAEKQAFLAFQETTEVSQQSARPDMISQQQASPLGRLILSFQNTPMQYARIMNKAARDLANGRGDTKTHLSKIAYYGVAQSILFGALQSALMASMGDDEEDDFDKKKERILNGMIDSVLSGIGYGGKAVSTVKNSIREYIKQKDKGWNADHTYTILSLLSFSPPIGSKLRKIYGSIQTEQFNQGVFTRRGLTLDNPIWSGIGNVVEGVTNVPLGRIAQKMLNIDNAMDDSNSFFERAALLLGWNTWDLGIKDKDIEAVKDELTEEKKVETKKKQKIKKEEKKIEKAKENEAVIKENKKKSKKDGICSAISKGGKRCKSKAVNGGFCTVHEKAEQNIMGVKSQCKKIKDGGKRCGMQTASKSGFCYYHD
jgi:hypothetical protein